MNTVAFVLLTLNLFALDASASFLRGTRHHEEPSIAMAQQDERLLAADGTALLDVPPETLDANLDIDKDEDEEEDEEERAFYRDLYEDESTTHTPLAEDGTALLDVPPESLDESIDIEDDEEDEDEDEDEEEESFYKELYEEPTTQVEETTNETQDEPDLFEMASDSEEDDDVQDEVPLQEEDTCTDIDSWFDADGEQYNCAWYSALHSRCMVYGDRKRHDGMTASEACCACGGGSR